MVRSPTRLSTTLVNLGQIAGRRGDLGRGSSGWESRRLRCGRRSAELLPRASELERRLSSRYGAERLVVEYGGVLREELCALPPGNAQQIEEAVGRRIDAQDGQ